MKTMLLRPALSLEAAELKFRGKYLSAGDYSTLIRRDAIGTLPGGEVKFLFLRSVLGSAQYLREMYGTFNMLPFLDVKESLREPLKGSKGQDLVIGYLRDGPTSAMRDYPIFCQWVLWPMLVRMQDLMREHLPERWKEQRKAAKRNGSRLVGAEVHTLVGVRITKESGKPHIITEQDIPQPLFSTVTVNKNPIFRSHADAKNEMGFACITTFGNFVGNALCFPRLRVAFDIQPGDLLIADTNREQHGSVESLAGTRISVVAYLRRMNASPAFL